MAFPQPHKDRRRQALVWGLVPSLTFALLALVLDTLLHVLAAVGVVVVARWASGAADLDATYRQSLGLVAALATAVRAPLLAVAAVVLASRRRGMSVRRYLGLRRVAPGRLLAWVGVALAVVLGAGGVLHLLGGPGVPESLVRLPRTAVSVPFYAFSTVVLAPLGDELFFRGLVLQGVRFSRFCGAGAAVLSAVWWAALGWQQDAPVLALLFVLGMLLGMARERTGSVVTSVAMHAVVNAVVLAAGLLA